MLECLLNSLQDQITEGLFTYSIVVVDNDDSRSAENVVAGCKKNARVPIDYYIEPEKNIARARNKAIESAKADYVAFIDDDEIPDSNWLINLLKALKAYKAQAVLGPVVPKFEKKPPEWIIKGKLCERPRYETGTVLQWSKTRTGNVLIDKQAIEANNVVFNPDFGNGGEDVVFFKELGQKGCVFIWCNEAPVYESVPIERCTKLYFFRRAFFQGNVSFWYSTGTLHYSDKLRIFIKSFVAVLIYTLILPLAYAGGTHRLMKYLIKDIHHVSRLLELSGLVVVKQRNF